MSARGQITRPMSGYRRFLTRGILLLALAACGGSRSSPEGTVSAFLDALEARDSAAFEASFTPGTRSLVAELEDLTRRIETGGGQPAITMDDWCRAFCGGTVEGSTLHGDSATVRVRVAGAVEEMSVIRAGNEWRIDLEDRYAPAVEMLRLIAAETPGDTAPTADGDTAGPELVPADSSP